VSKEERRTISKSNVPYLAEIRKAGPLDEICGKYLQHEAKEIEVKKINAEITEIKRENPALDDLTERLRKSYEAYRKRQVQAIAKYIYAGANAPDRFARMSRHLDGERLDVLARDVFEEALEYLREQGYTGISDAERKKQIAALEKKKSKLLSEMEELLPANQFTQNHYQSGAAVNIVAVFVDFWRGLQEWTLDNCDFQGMSLKFSDDEVKRAHAALNLSALKSRVAKVYAHQPNPVIA